MSTTTKTKKRYIYCEARGSELEQRTRDGWELANDRPAFDSHFGPMVHGYLLRREEPPAAEHKQREQLRVLTKERQDLLKTLQQIEKLEKAALNDMRDANWPLHQYQGKRPSANILASRAIYARTALQQIDDLLRRTAKQFASES